MHFNIPGRCQNTTKSFDEKTSMSKDLILPRLIHTIYMVGHESGKCRSTLNSAWSCWDLVPVPALSQLEASRTSVLPALMHNNPLSWDWVAVSCSAVKQGTFDLSRGLKGWAQDYAKMVWLGAAGKAFFALVTLKAAPAQTETSTKLHNQLNQLLPPS